jgi:hypothetical protein
LTKIAILQSNYIPWKGYFDLIAAVDEFVLYDDVQFTKNDWRNRNRIKTPQGAQWLTVPVGDGIHRRIRDVELQPRWQARHWKTIEANYRRAPHFEAIASWLRPLYLQEEHHNLSAMNRRFIQAVCDHLGVRTRIRNSWDYVLGVGRTDRLADLCVQAGATEYVSGPSARDYIDPAVFERAGVHLAWFDYDGYPEYPQLWGAFTHHVSIVDLLFNCGPLSPRYMRYVQQ